jgi:hypothetical protein
MAGLRKIFPMRHIPKTQIIELAIVVGLFSVAYLTYRIGVGIPFVVLDDMHFLDAKGLVDDLFGSMLYLHSQPPLMNFIKGVVHIFWPVSYALAFEFFYFILGAASVILLMLSMQRLDISKGIRIAVCVVLCSFPTFYIYAMWAYTTHIEFFLSAVAIYFFTGFYTADSNKSARSSVLKLFLTLGILGLLHARWHLVVILGLAFIMLFLENSVRRKQIMYACIVGMLPLFMWYSKNHLLFGFWGASSWMGTNVVQVASMTADKASIDEMKLKGLISEDFPAVYDWKKIIARVPPDSVIDRIHHISVESKKYPGWENYNYIGLIDSSKQDMRDALVIIRHDPARYVKRALESMWNTMWIPSLSYPNVVGLSYIMRFTGRDAPISHPYFVLPEGLRSTLGFGSFLLYFAVPLSLLALALLSWRKWQLSCQIWLRYLLFSIYVCAVTLAISCFANGWEQERIRWGDVPFYLCNVAILIEIIRRYILSLYTEKLFPRRNFQNN